MLGCPCTVGIKVALTLVPSARSERRIWMPLGTTHCGTPGVAHAAADGTAGLRRDGGSHIGTNWVAIPYEVIFKAVS
jgi:hypothetical protein